MNFFHPTRIWGTKKTNYSRVGKEKRSRLLTSLSLFHSSPCAITKFNSVTSTKISKHGTRSWSEEAEEEVVQGQGYVYRNHDAIEMAKKGGIAPPPTIRDEDDDHLEAFVIPSPAKTTRRPGHCCEIENSGTAAGMTPSVANGWERRS